MTEVAAAMPGEEGLHGLEAAICSPELLVQRVHGRIRQEVM
eukprot:CAMPEP_0115605610 /NCGR_PEP_ID=MMETSP0272-20121206/17552_1 /TAXON_ID=71861 /ORGANISM="Scrippsiella trochoidea, Strain CCMP3099" /LENGTH=40 /DNA_ID= /DNA_START= /DNA_END= /DNA_ORIENTATION=